MTAHSQADLQTEVQQKQRHRDRALEFVDAVPVGIARLEASVAHAVRSIDDPQVCQSLLSLTAHFAFENRVHSVEVFFASVALISLR